MNIILANKENPDCVEYSLSQQRKIRTVLNIILANKKNPDRVEHGNFEVEYSLLAKLLAKVLSEHGCLCVTAWTSDNASQK